MKFLIQFARGQRPAIEVDAGVNLMQALLAAGLPVASSCRGDGVCAKCRLQVQGSSGGLPPPNETEKFLKQKFDLGAEVRISCQLKVRSDLIVDATYW